MPLFFLTETLAETAPQEAVPEPGFGAVLGLIGLMIVVYIVRKYR